MMSYLLSDDVRPKSGSRRGRAWRRLGFSVGPGVFASPTLHSAATAATAATVPSSAVVFLFCFFGLLCQAVPLFSSSDYFFCLLFFLVFSFSFLFFVCEFVFVFFLIFVFFVYYFFRFIDLVFFFFFSSSFVFTLPIISSPFLYSSSYSLFLFTFLSSLSLYFFLFVSFALPFPSFLLLSSPPTLLLYLSPLFPFRVGSRCKFFPPPTPLPSLSPPLLRPLFAALIVLVSSFPLIYYLHFPYSLFLS